MFTFLVHLSGHASHRRYILEVASYRYVAHRDASLIGIHHRDFQISISNGRTCELIDVRKYMCEKIDFHFHSLISAVDTSVGA
jgi:hypothetical protein